MSDEIRHLDPEGEDERCPTCGQRVRTVVPDESEGTSYYLAVAEQEASEAEYLRSEVKRLQREINYLVTGEES